MPDGFAKFCKKYAKRKRSDLRKETVAKLKDIAKQEQKKILEETAKDLGKKGKDNRTGAGGCLRRRESGQRLRSTLYGLRSTLYGLRSLFSTYHPADRRLRP